MTNLRTYGHFGVFHDKGLMKGPFHMDNQNEDMTKDELMQRIENLEAKLAEKDRNPMLEIDPNSQLAIAMASPNKAFVKSVTSGVSVFSWVIYILAILMVVGMLVAKH